MYDDQDPEREVPLPLPAPKSKLAVEGGTVAPPGEQRVTLSDVTFELGAGYGPDP